MISNPASRICETRVSARVVRSSNPVTNEAYRALMKFDLAGALPANAVISTATLSLRVFLTSNSDPGATEDENVNFNFYKVTSSWVEGTGTDEGNAFVDNGIVQPGSVSWLAREDKDSALEHGGWRF